MGSWFTKKKRTQRTQPYWFFYLWLLEKKKYPIDAPLSLGSLQSLDLLESSEWMMMPMMKIIGLKLESIQWRTLKLDKEKEGMRGGEMKARRFTVQRTSSNVFSSIFYSIFSICILFLPPFNS